MIDTNKTRRKPFPIALSLNDKPKAINLFSLLSPLSQSVHSTRIKKYEKHNLKLTKSPVKKLQSPVQAKTRVLRSLDPKVDIKNSETRPTIIPQNNLDHNPQFHSKKENKVRRYPQHRVKSVPNLQKFKQQSNLQVTSLKSTKQIKSQLKNSAQNHFLSLKKQRCFSLKDLKDRSIGIKQFLNYQKVCTQKSNSGHQSSSLYQTGTLYQRDDDNYNNYFSTDTQNPSQKTKKWNKSKHKRAAK